MNSEEELERKNALIARVETAMAASDGETVALQVADVRAILEASQALFGALPKINPILSEARDLGPAETDDALETPAPTRWLSSPASTDAVRRYMEDETPW